jgi:PAS domain S-box-containing protein
MREMFASQGGTESLQERLQVVTDSGSLAMWEVDLRTGELTWSVNGDRFLGLPPGKEANNLEELIAFVHHEDRARIAEVVSTCVSSGVAKRQERFRVLRDDGTVRHISAYAHFVADDDATPHRMVGMALDVTDIVEYERQLRETDERLRTAYEAAKVWTCRLDLQDWTITRPSLSGRSNAPQFGQGQPFQEWVQHIHPEDRARVEAGMRKAIETGDLWEDEFRLKWPDGKYHWIYDRGRCVEIPGQPKFFAGAAMDIDDRKQVEQRLIENEERLRSAYVAGKMWPWELEISSGRIRRPDDMPNGRTGWITLSEWLDDIHPEDRERVRYAIDSAKLGSGPYSCDYRLRWADGEYHWLNSRGGLIQDTRGTWKLMGIARDCTEERRTADALAESERLRLLSLDAANMGVFSQDMRTGRVRWSERQFKLYGVKREEFGGTAEAFRKLVLPEDFAHIKQQHEQQIALRSRQFRHEFRIRRPIDGAIRWMASAGEINYDESGTPDTMMGVNYDITESREHEQQLRQSQRLQSIALGAAEMGVWQQDLVTGKIQWTERQYELFGLKPEEFDGTVETAFRNVHPEDRVRLTHECSELEITHGARHVTEFRILLPDGGVRWLAAVGEISYNDSGTSLQSVGVNFDITERRRHEEALRRSERLRRLSLSAAGMGAFEWDITTGEISWSPEQYQLLKYDPETVRPTLEHFESRVHPDDLLNMQLLMQLLVTKQEKRYRNEFRIQWPNGVTRWVRTLGEFVYDANGQVTRMFGVNWDVTDQKETEQRIVQLNRELQRKVADFEALMHAMPIAVAVGLDPELKDVRVNPTFAQMMGIADHHSNVAVTADGKDGRGFRFTRDGEEIPPEQLPLRKAARLNQEIRNEELELVTKEGRRVDMFGHAVPILDENGDVRGSLAAFLDITERKRAEHALRTGEKLATAGKMAASLAHEINNPLAAVTNLLYLIAQDESVSENSKRYISMATSEIARVSQITRNILAFYRESNLPVHVDMGELMDSVLELYAPKIRDSNVELNFDRASSERVMAFPGELRQVFSNLVVNAVDAMPRGGKLRIRIRTGSDRRSERRGVRVVVADTGVGIPREQFSHLFEPFFTTKGEKGTGLGLWVSRDIISKHDGTVHIRTSSAESKSGTCFSIFLPSESVSVRQRAKIKASSVSSH